MNLTGVAALFALLASSAHAAGPHNVILFVADGLRASAVDESTAPEMTELRTRGVTFANSFSVYPTFTMVNASALATGHQPGDTGVFGNTILANGLVSIDPTRKSVTPFLEYDPALRDMNVEIPQPNGFITEETLIGAARRAGFSTAAIGKLGPVALHDIGGLNNPRTIVIDDATGTRQGLPLADDIAGAIESVTGNVASTPTRGQNGTAGGCETGGTLIANVTQIPWFADVATKVVLPRFKAAGKPFLLVFWSRDPDGTQHNQGDSPGRVVPGINGPTSHAAIRNADNALRQIRAAVHDLGLEATTDIIVAADHGFSTISKESKTSSSASLPCATVEHALPQGFLGMDLAHALNLNAYDPDADNTPVHLAPKDLSSRGNIALGADPTHTDAVVAVGGGSDLIYLPSTARNTLAPQIVSFLLRQDYVSGIFLDDAFGNIPGTLPLSAINLQGGARTIRPAMVVNFRSFATGCANPLLCAAEIADTPLVQGQGMHGTFSRADTNNFLAAIGPSFKPQYVDHAPASNADTGMTIARILGLQIHPTGKLTGRVLSEALGGGKDIVFGRRVIQGPPADGLATTVILQEAGGVRYLEAGGFPGRTVGLDAAN